MRGGAACHPATDGTIIDQDNLSTLACQQISCRYPGDARANDADIRRQILHQRCCVKSLRGAFPEGRIRARTFSRLLHFNLKSFRRSPLALWKLRRMLLLAAKQLTEHRHLAYAPAEILSAAIITVRRVSLFFYGAENGEHPPNKDSANPV